MNSTFYGQPRPNVSLGWVRRTPPGFEFSVKLFQKFTHPATSPDTTPVSAADVDAFRAGIEPLAAGGRLGALLAQFPSRFHDTPEARDYLQWLLRTFGDYPLAVELRHRSWSDAAADTTALLAEAGAAWVQIDEPKFASSVQQELEPNAALMYVRLHGRNAAQWWTHEQSEDRYNYLYSGPELQPIVDKLRAARAAGAEAVSLHEQPLRRAGGGQRDDGAAVDGRARDGADAVRAGLGLPDAGGPRHDFASRTVTLMMRSVTCSLATTSIPLITLPKTVYLPSSAPAG